MLSNLVLIGLITVSTTAVNRLAATTIGTLRVIILASISAAVFTLLCATPLTMP